MERRVMTRKVRRSLIWLVVLVGLGWGIYIIITRGFKIDKVEIINYPAEVTFNWEKVTDNLIFFPAEKVREEILRTNSRLADILIQKKFPRTLVFLLVPRSSIARLLSGGYIYMLDKDAVILGEALGGDKTPLIKSDDTRRYAMGASIIVPEIRAAAKVIGSLTPYSMPEMQLTASTSAIRGVHEAGEILFPIVSDYGQIAATLQSLWAGFRIKGTFPKFIDLRFKQPVVNF